MWAAVDASGAELRPLIGVYGSPSRSWLSSLSSIPWGIVEDGLGRGLGLAGAWGRMAQSATLLQLQHNNSHQQIDTWSDAHADHEDSDRSSSVVPIPHDVSRVIDAIGCPWLLRSFTISPMDISLSLRLRRPVYLALDHSRLHVGAFTLSSGSPIVATTSYVLGRSLVSHYTTTGVLLEIGNPMRLVGSLELLGSPASLAHSLGSGVSDLVLYPYERLAHGPRGLIAGLGHGLSSLLRNMTSVELINKCKG